MTPPADQPDPDGPEAPRSRVGTCAELVDSGGLTKPRRHGSTGGPVQSQAPHLPDRRDDRMLAWAQVREIVGLSRTTAWRLQKHGIFPMPVQVSNNRIAWRESEIAAWCANLAPRSRSPLPSAACEQ